MRAISKRGGCVESIIIISHLSLDTLFVSQVFFVSSLLHVELDSCGVRGQQKRGEAAYMWEKICIKYLFVGFRFLVGYHVTVFTQKLIIPSYCYSCNRLHTYHPIGYGRRRTSFLPLLYVMLLRCTKESPSYLRLERSGEKSTHTQLLCVYVYVPLRWWVFHMNMRWKWNSHSIFSIDGEEKNLWLVQYYLRIYLNAIIYINKRLKLLTTYYSIQRVGLCGEDDALFHARYIVLLT